MARISVVDDESIVLEICKRIYGMDGHEVTTYPTGRGFLDAEGPDDHDYVHLDGYMAGMNGMDVLRTMRGRGDNTPVIMVSGKLHNYPEEMEEVRLLGADYLAKPFTADDVLARARKNLDGGGPAQVSGVTA